ncbi:hypothetical protein A2924_04140 [Candidatus Giovannonibacteria bacterium RIFCSPLOWO2_01_FULL_44_16]|uniref:Uncharacterized protein n=1 Tax=Candidatus Giovannonibacteria bacterium RIFCSPLOWO2_01_FULL_44_16 TaxID=1798348 RepID=A0A1F5X5D8_9BACT|nr:MAG: hypothetical protein A2924_04140 [Candidatus Giovannonibacteria bacterium RIFCSPLOWO2_01_FULL_44_16]
MWNKIKFAISRLKSFLNRHFFDIMAVIIIILTITALLGLWRLKTITPPKEPIKIDDYLNAKQ